MRTRWRELFTSKVNVEVPWDRWDFVALGLAVSTVIWGFALKLQTFWDLGYTSDLFVSVQLARSWLEGRGLLQDNCFGNGLAIHTYFLLSPLGLLAKPFGAPGLLFVLAASVGTTYFCAARVLRLLGVGGPVALIAAGALLASPLSVAFYQEPSFGFHVEVLSLALCLILFYFLLRQRIIESVLTALVVMSVKEDAPVAAAMVAIVAGVETWVSSAGRQARHRLNRPAMIVLLVSVVATPVLLAVSWAQPPTISLAQWPAVPPVAYAQHSVDRLWIVPRGTLRSPEALFLFIGANLAHWLGSGVVRQWFWIMIIGSFGTILLRPHYVICGVVTTVVAWLMQRNDLLWAPRFYLTEALLWCVTLVGFASITRAITLDRIRARVALLATAIAITASCATAQLALVPNVGEAYLLRSGGPYSVTERQQADELFARYRHEAKRQEPVVASPTLFRYAHDANLFWLDRLHGRPAPIWILSDGSSNYGYDDVHIADGNLLDNRDRLMLRTTDYTVVDRRGHFVLLKKRE
jgi:hypothetical protein